MNTVTEKLLTYALGRGLEDYDMPAVRKIVRDAAPDGYRMQAIVARHRQELSVPVPATRLPAPDAAARPRARDRACQRSEERGRDDR